jgi:DNA-binding HxlR family transcriptional regulator
MHDARPYIYAHIHRVQEVLALVISDLQARSLQHDQSKLVPPEIDIFNEFQPKLKGSTFGSPEYQKFLEGMKVGLDHHYANNSHHPQYYPNGVMGMSLIDVLEMLCDWIAACEQHDDGHILDSIEINRKRFDISPEIITLMLNTLPILGNPQRRPRKLNPESPPTRPQV